MDTLKVQIQSSVQAILPSISKENASLIAEMLVDDGGLESAEDLKFVTPEDFAGVLKPIQIRKLIQTWKDKGKKLRFKNRKSLKIV